MHQCLWPSLTFEIFWEKKLGSGRSRVRKTDQINLPNNCPDPFIVKNKDGSVCKSYIKKCCSQARQMSAAAVESDADFDARYVSYFNRADIDGWEIRKVSFTVYMFSLHSRVQYQWCRSRSAFWYTSWIRIRIRKEDADPDPKGKNRRKFANKCCLN